MMNETLNQKKNLRKILTEKRNLIKKNTNLEFNIETFNQLTEQIKFNAIDCIGSFMSIRSEISTKQLNTTILKMKKKLAFPTIEKNLETLIFKTIAKLKKLNLAFYTVGFAYDDQKQNKLPVEKFDYKLDFVLTEKQLYTFL